MPRRCSFVSTPLRRNIGRSPSSSAISRSTAQSGDGLLPGPDDPATGASFVIPAGANGHTETMQYTFSGLRLGGVTPYLYGVGGHMHLAGVDEKVSLTKADGSNECLLQSALGFRLATPLRLRYGDREASGHLARRQAAGPLHLRQHHAKPEDRQRATAAESAGSS